MRTPTKTPLFPLLAVAALAVSCEQPIGPGGATAPGPVPGGEPNTGRESGDGTAAKATDPGNDPNCELIEKDDRGTERWLCSRAEGGPEGGGVICWHLVTVTRIVYDGKVEEVVTEELLFCEPDFNRVFLSFTRDDGPFKQALETRTSTPVSPVIWEWREHDTWTQQALRPVRHHGKDGC